MPIPEATVSAAGEAGFDSVKIRISGLASRMIARLTGFP